MKWHISLAFLILILVTSSCSNQPGIDGLETGKSLRLTIHLQQSKYCLGEPVVTTVTLTNVGKETLLINSRMSLNKPGLSSPIRELAFNIKTPHGENYDPILYVSPKFFEKKDFIDLGPEDVFDFTFYFASNSYIFPEVGDYKIMANYQNFVDPSAIDPDDNRTAWKGDLNSNEVILTIIQC